MNKPLFLLATLAAASSLAMADEIKPAAETKKPTTPVPAAAETAVTHTTGADAKKLLDENAAAVKAGKAEAITVVDVRTPDEYAEGHIAGSKNVDFHGTDFEKDLAKLDKTKPVLVHCQAGGRSKSSLAAFKRLGFKTVIHMDGGINAWKAAGHPVGK